MRAAIRTAWHTALLWAYGMAFLIPFREPSRYLFLGATEDWSPRAAVAAVQAPQAWDVQGWLRQGNARFHNDLREVEHELDKGLSLIVDSVYKWRDSDDTNSGN